MPRAHYVNREALRYYRYRQQFHESDRRQMGIVILGGTLAICATLRNDFILLGVSWYLAVALTSRLVHVSATVLLLFFLWRAKRPHQLDLIGSTWTILTAIYLTVVAVVTRLPKGEILGPIFGAAAGIAIFYFAQRGRLCGRMIANAICTIQLLIMLWHPSSPISKAARTTGPLTVLLLNVIGIASARSFEEQRRKRFEAERLQRTAHRELAAKNQELALQKENAESMYRARTAFLAAMSHEFRTPMNAVIGLSDVLVNAPLEPQYREHARTIRDSASALLVLLNDVLDFAKIDAGKLELSPAPFDLRALLGSIVDMMRPATAAKQIDLITRFSTEIPECLVGDDARLRQVLVNLLSNAIKFTSRGAVTFVVTSRVLDKPIHEIWFAIEDSGIGMSPEVMARLFRPFEQGDGGVSRRYGGTGLGLVISKQIVIAMGGDIHVESCFGQGSKFSFNMQLEEATAPVASVTSESRKSEGGSGSLAILIVDDLPVNRTVARVMLERLGYRADFANDGHAAIEAATQKDYDVIFMDLQMPGMNGIEATKNIAEKLAGKQMPQVIAMSASVFEEDRAACRAAGMRDFIAKPIDFMKLDMTLERIAGKRERSMPAARNTTSLDLAPLEQLRQLEALDQPGFVANLCQEFLADTPLRIQRMTDALGSGELAVLEREAHSLKSSSASLGAAEMSKLCATIESSARKMNIDDVEQLLKQLAHELPRVESGLRRQGLV